MNAFDLINHLSILIDPRQSWKVEHKLTGILLLTICGVIAGADGWQDIKDWGDERLEWLRKYGEFKNEIPSPDTIARVVSLINPAQFQKCFCKWMKECHKATDGAVIAIDGKTARRSYDKSRKSGPIHMVSAFASANSVVLGQVKTDEKSNEITAIPELLDMLEIKGCLITIDAMGCQRDIAKKIVKKEGDYLLAVKGNQGRLQNAFEEHFSLSKVQSWQGDSYTTTEKIHGRTETRMHIVSDIFDEFVNHSFDWQGLKTLGVAISIRSKGDETPDIKSMSIRYYISSAALTAEKFAHTVRDHWSVENGLHWKLDVAMGEDNCRIRRGDCPEILASLRRLAINLLNNITSFKGGMKRKMKKAAMNTTYMEEVLEGAELVFEDLPADQ